MSCTAEELPHELWTMILKHVPYYRRLSTCALVCQKLARAAAAATQTLELAFNSPKCHDAFLNWTNRHGTSLTSLYLDSSPDHTPVRQLPCPNLVKLELTYGSAQLCAGSEGLGLLHSCTALTRLYMEGSTLLDDGVGGPAGAAPAATARLQSLRLWDCGLAREGTAQALEQRLFPHLTSLTCLDVSGDYKSELLSCFPPHISSMASLQELRWTEAGPITAATLPGIERLTALENVSLSLCHLEPSCLVPMTTGLTKLSLYNVALQPHQAQQDSKLGAAQLLQLLARLTALRVLTLTTIKGHWPQQQLSQYSALTASSNLQELQCNNSNIPGAALAHVFPAGRQLPNLQRFFLHSAIEQPLAAFDSLGIARLASCCPAVEDLNFTPAADVSLAPLKSLSALTHLHIGPVSPAVIRSDLTALAQLQSLDVSVSLPAAGAGEDVSPGLQHLLPLTALTGLTCFSSWCDDRYMGLFSNAPTGTPPDVWVQLLGKCIADPASQPAIASSVVQQLQQQRGQVAQQAALLQQQQQQEKSAHQAALLHQHEQELAAARAEAAELRGQVQTLQEQLRVVLAALKQLQRA